MPTITLNQAFSIFLTSLFVFCAANSIQAEAPYQIEWSSQYGTEFEGQPRAISADGYGNIYTAGLTGSASAQNSQDAFVNKFSDSGTLDWTAQVGSLVYDEAFGVASDGLGNVYLAGITEGTLAGPNAGQTDAFIGKIDANGGLLWTRQFGTSTYEYVGGTAVDTLGNVFLSGSTDGSLEGTNLGSGDAFLRKYDSMGDVQWTRQLGSVSYEASTGVTTDGLGNVYITGTTSGAFAGTNLGASDSFLSKFDYDGNLQWTRQWGTVENDISWSVSADGLGNVFVGGYAWAAPGHFNAEAFVSKFDDDGNLLWTTYIGDSSADTIGLSVSADGFGNAFISGQTWGLLDDPNTGPAAFASKVNSAGALLWTVLQENSPAARGIAADGLGNAYFTGNTYWTELDGSSAFLVRLAPVPEPTSGLLFAWALPILAAFRRRSRLVGRR